MVAAELVLAVEYLHSMDVTHRDLKPENVVFTTEGHAQVIDLGTATRSPTAVCAMVGSANYMAPEVVRNTPSHHPSDLWALGCIVFEMLEGTKAFDGPSDFLVWKKVLEGQVAYGEYCTGAAKDFCQALLAVQPDGRLGAGSSGCGSQDIQGHALFDGIVFADLPRRSFEHAFLKGAEHLGL